MAIFKCKNFIRLIIYSVLLEVLSKLHLVSLRRNSSVALPEAEKMLIRQNVCGTLRFFIGWRFVERHNL